MKKEYLEVGNIVTWEQTIQESSGNEVDYRYTGIVTHILPDERKIVVTKIEAWVPSNLLNGQK